MASYITTHVREQVWELPPKNLPCTGQTLCAACHKMQYLPRFTSRLLGTLLGFAEGWGMASYITTHAREHVCELPPKNLPCAVVKHCAQLAIKCSICHVSRHAYSARRWALARAGGWQVISPHMPESTYVSCHPRTCLARLSNIVRSLP